MNSLLSFGSIFQGTVMKRYKKKLKQFYNFSVSFGTDFYL
jgi:hypothetical protein